MAVHSLLLLTTRYRHDNLLQTDTFQYSWTYTPLHSALLDLHAPPLSSPLSSALSNACKVFLSVQIPACVHI